MRRLIFFVVFGLFFASFVSAQFGVSTTYSDNFPLKLKPGEELGAFFKVKHFDDKVGKITIEVLPEESEIAEFIEADKIHEISFGEEFRVPVVVKIPEDAEVGAEYRVAALFKTVDSDSEGGGGNVRFTFNIRKDFPIVVIGDSREEVEIAQGEVIESPKDEKKSGEISFFLLLLVLAIGIISVYFIIIRERRKAKLVSYYQDA